MTETRGERRAQTAKQNDDSDIIDAAARESGTTKGQRGSAGGILQRDLGTQAEERRVDDPEGHESVKKGDHIARGDESTPPHPAEHVVTERK